MWQGLFLISIAQAVFLLSLMMVRIKEKTMDFFLVSLLLVALAVTNADFFFISSGVYTSFPYAFGSSFGLMLLFGPIFYLYAQGTIHSEYRWRPSLLFHFVPYGVNLLLNIPIYLTASPQKIQFINELVANGVQLRLFDKVLVGIQCLHFLIYLMVTQRRIRMIKPGIGNVAYIVAANRKVQWFNLLFYVFLAYELVIVVLLIQVILVSQLRVEVNYVYTLLTSAIIYLLAYSVILNPDLLAPGLGKRYRNTKDIDAIEANEWMERLSTAMEQRKVYRNPDLSLEILSQETQIPKNQLSRLINERLQRSFNDYVNEYRIREFIALYNNPEYQSYNIYGIAQEAGFNHKSTFNAAFKKATGKTPTEYKKAMALVREK